MKTAVKIYCIILLILTCIGLALESQQDYSKERLLWSIHKDFKKISDPQSPENEFIVKKIIDRYEFFIRKNAGSQFIPKAKLGLANVLLLQSNYKEAREIYEEVISNYKYNAEVVVQAEYALGQSYEKENNWPKAVTIYRAIIREYPITTIGFSMPYYLGNFYLSRGLNSTALTAYNEAADFYQNIASNYPDSPLGYSSLEKLIKCYLALNRWSDAFFAAKQLFFEYPLASALQDTIQLIRDIGFKKLHNPDIVILTYKEFINKNSGHPINFTLQKIIRKITMERN